MTSDAGLLPDRPVAPWLVLAWGNRSRGDDALGPLLLDRLIDWLDALPRHQARTVECLEEQQLQVEHALDLRGRRAVLFIDAAVGLASPWRAESLSPRRDTSFTTHALSPQAVMQAHREVCGTEPPPCTLLSLRAAQFELGTAPSAQALLDLSAAEDRARQWLGECWHEPAGPSQGRIPACVARRCSSEQEP